MGLLDQVRDKVRLKHYAYATEKCYVRWVARFVRFHEPADGWRHPRTLGAREVEQFLTYLAVERRVAARTQNQAFGALPFLYEHVMELPPGDVSALRGLRKKRMPAVPRATRCALA